MSKSKRCKNCKKWTENDIAQTTGRCAILSHHIVGMGNHYHTRENFRCIDWEGVEDSKNWKCRPKNVR